jgi:hypothetical protein
VITPALCRLLENCLEVNAAGAPALLARAKDAAADRRLLFIHGGGYVAGAIDTHHKMYASLAKAVGARALLMAGRAPEADHAIAGLTGWPNLAA